MRRIGADVGGTFTDVILADADGRSRSPRCSRRRPPTTAPSSTAVAGSLRRRRRGRARDDRRDERRARAPRRAHALVTTEGFRDVLELRRMRMPHLYDSFWTKPPSLVPRRHRFEIAERMAADGDGGAPARRGRGARARGAARATPRSRRSRSACCTRTSTPPTSAPRRDPARGAARASPSRSRARSCASSRSTSAPRRRSSTRTSAADGPLRRRPARRARRRGRRRSIMQSSGGMMTAADAAERPVYALESGPAAGVVAALSLARELGHANAIAFDMGGTTAKASLIEDGRVSRSQEYEVGASLSAGSRLLRGSGELIRIPTIDIAEVGAGGGSIAWLDAAGAAARRAAQRGRGARAGLLRPRRHGADGDRRERRARLHPDRAAIGRLTVSRSWPRALARGGRSACRRSRPRAASTTSRTRTMMRALRAVSTEKGRDPARLRARRLRRLGPGARRGARGRARRAHGDRAAARGPLLRGRAAVRARRVPRRALLPGRRARAGPRRCSGTLDARDARADGDAVAAQSPTSATAARAGASRSTARRARRGGARRARRALRGRARAALRHAARARLAGRHPRAPARRARPRATATALRARRPERRDGTRLADFGAGHGARHAGRLARVDRAEPAAARCWSTSTTRPSSSRRAGRCASTATRRARARPRRASTAGARRHDGDDRDAPRRQRARDRRRRDGDAIFRTAHSAVVRDAMDFSAALCGPTGETVAQAVTIPLQLGSIPNAMRTLLERFGDGFAPGDVFIVNDPFDGASHTPDIFVVKPSFDGDRLLGFAVTVAHHGDIGGRVPGLVRLRQHRGLPGGAAPAVDPALRPRRAGRGAVRDPPRERAHPARAARRPRRAGRRVPRSATARCRSSPSGTARAARDADGRPARPHRGAAPRRDRELARRHRDVHRLPRTRTGSTCATSRSPST